MMLLQSVLWRKLIGTGLFIVLVLAACAPSESGDTLASADNTTVSADTGTDSETVDPTSIATFPIAEDITILTEDDRPQRLLSATRSWNTNWNKHTIDYNELLSGGPPRDGIPSIDAPTFVSYAEAGVWLADNEPVIALELNGDARAYPLQILMWHEIVNDTVGEIPVIATFCPLCNSALVFDRRVNGDTVEFGTSGLLRNSDLVMYDRTTETLWQQFTGEAIVGDLTGMQLTFLPSQIVSFADFRNAFPDGVVLSRDTGFNRNYGENPYVGYDDITQSPFLYDGIPDDRLRPMERVVTVDLGDSNVAYPLSILFEQGVINDTRGGRDLVVFHVGGTASVLDARSIADSDDVGATGVFDPNLDGRKLTFRKDGEQIFDNETGSEWNVLGQAIAGELAGTRLDPIIHADHFWFSWAAFKPETEIYQG
ncbi:MAG: DUF3179 domain-containing protein [Anaerolineae bacterium]|nr:DUF3179 domain-containing protein [Anaerolineae bacterium]